MLLVANHFRKREREREGEREREREIIIIFMKAIYLDACVPLIVCMLSGERVWTLVIASSERATKHNTQHHNFQARTDTIDTCDGMIGLPN